MYGDFDLVSVSRCSSIDVSNLIRFESEKLFSCDVTSPAESVDSV